MPAYPGSLTDVEWEIIRPILPDAPMGLRGRPREHSRRDLLNGIFYILRTGGAWRFMPNDLPHWKTCYHYFRLWAKQATGSVSTMLSVTSFASSTVKKAPTAAIFDSQSVRSASQSGLRGYDAGKRITGRKRRILVDTLGNPLSVEITPANVRDRDGARLLLKPLATRFGWLMKIWADGGYAGALEGEVARLPRHRQIDQAIAAQPTRASAHVRKAIMLFRRNLMKEAIAPVAPVSDGDLSPWTGGIWETLAG